jgi:ABC-type nitrate/sulfonate/bicarbonate transport system permease component
MIIWFGASNGGVEALVIWGCFFIMVVETEEALKNVPTVHRWAALTLGESSWGLRLRVMLPASIPGLMGGLRISMVSAVNLTILGEFNIASGGVGDLIIRGYDFLQTPLLYLGVLIAVGLALVLDWLVRLIRVLVVRWA